MIMDIRNEKDIELAKLKSTEHLKTQLPFTQPVAIEEKEDGQRYSLELSFRGKFLVSRSRHGRTKGKEISKDQPFINVALEPWMNELVLDSDVILDGELRTVGTSTSSEVSKLSTEKEFVVFDCLWLDEDLRNLPNGKRFSIAEQLVAIIGHPRLRMIKRKVYSSGFTFIDLEDIFEEIKESGIEGYVLKLLNDAYEKNNYGWKIKIKDTCDAFITDYSEEKKHNLGKVTRTGRVGSVKVCWHKGWKILPVAWVPLLEEDRCLLENGSSLTEKVVEFGHLGWTGSSFRSPEFKKWRIDKTHVECIWDESKTKICDKSILE